MGGVTSAAAVRSSGSHSHNLIGRGVYSPSKNVKYILWLTDQLPMAECANCGAIVTEQYVRVFAPTGMETVRVCPECPDMLRDGGEVREAKSPR